MSSFYLAARFGRRDELNKYRADLEGHGHIVTSRWLTQRQKLDLRVHNYTSEERLNFALQDYEDVMRASRFIAFTENPSEEETVPGGKRGGRHVELGLALAAHKIIYVVGFRENVFCHLPSIQFYETFEKLMENLWPQRN